MKPINLIKLVGIAILACLTLAEFTIQASSTPDYIRAVAWDSTGDQIAIATETGTIQILDTSGQVVRSLQNGGAGVYTLAWSPDGTRLASGGADKVVRVWDVVAGKVAFTLTGHTGSILSVAWDPDGTRIVSASYEDTPQNVRIWNAVTGQQLSAISAGAAPAVAWSPDGERLAVSQFQRLEIWDAASGQSVKQIKTPEYGLFIAWSPDGTKIASADSYTNDKSTIRIWDVATGQLATTLTGHTNVALSVSWSPDGTKIASTGHDHTVRIWDVASGQSLTVIQARDSVFRAAWSPFGGRLAYGDVATQGTSSTANAAATPGAANASTGLHIIVPPATLKDLQAIVRRCVNRTEVQTTLMPDLDTNQLSSFIAKVKGLSNQQIGPGCAADLIAVADALQKK